MLKELEKVIDDKTETIPIVRFEPAVTRAVNFAIADGLIEIQSSNSKMKLTDKGKKIYSEILQDSDLMILEKQELSQIKDKLKDSVINRIIEKWGEK
jgi:Mn-dependent DtxR family transcriptional regulator